MESVWSGKYFHQVMTTSFSLNLSSPNRKQAASTQLLCWCENALYSRFRWPDVVWHCRRSRFPHVWSGNTRLYLWLMCSGHQWPCSHARSGVGNTLLQTRSCQRRRDRGDTLSGVKGFVFCHGYVLFTGGIPAVDGNWSIYSLKECTDGSLTTGSHCFMEI